MVERRLHLRGFTLIISGHAQQRMIERKHLLPTKLSITKVAHKAWGFPCDHIEIPAGNGLLCFDRREGNILVLKTFCPTRKRVGA